ncbi:hypothetical protein YC2023_121131 [Brassica napus]|uniref:(rape) hypothetical protein n=1 Tax=Brassica napus TaxID=3708 RepID=A0A817BBI9_BRANA|nr:unnamed protein product [Brassica napus]
MHHFSKSTAKNPTRGEGEAFNDSPASRNHSDLICRAETAFLFDSVNSLLIWLTLERVSDEVKFYSSLILDSSVLMMIYKELHGSVKYLFPLFTQVKLKPKGTIKL